MKDSSAEAEIYGSMATEGRKENGSVLEPESIEKLCLLLPVCRDGIYSKSLVVVLGSRSRLRPARPGRERLVIECVKCALIVESVIGWDSNLRLAQC